MADAVNWARHQRAPVGVCVQSGEAELAAVFLATGTTHSCHSQRRPQCARPQRLDRSGSGPIGLPLLAGSQHLKLPATPPARNWLAAIAKHQNRPSTRGCRTWPPAEPQCSSQNAALSRRGPMVVLLRQRAHGSQPSFKLPPHVRHRCGDRFARSGSPCCSKVCGSWNTAATTRRGLPR